MPYFAPQAEMMASFRNEKIFKTNFKENKLYKMGAFFKNIFDGFVTQYVPRSSTESLPY